MCVENISSKDVYVFFILRRRVQRYCTAVRDGKNKKHIHRRHKFLCVLNKNIYLPDTVQRIIAERRIGRSAALIKIHLKRKTPHDIHEVFFVLIRLFGLLADISKYTSVHIKNVTVDRI